jgi:hypothetical protein
LYDIEEEASDAKIRFYNLGRRMQLAKWPVDQIFGKMR